MLVQCPICGQYVVSTVINVHIDNNCPSPEEEEKPTVVDTTTATSDNNIHTTKETPTRMAPLFAPKSQAQKQTAPIFKSSSNSSLKRTIETPPQPVIKRNKKDVVAESMPLAAKGIKINSYQKND